jgi:hypothetical protein
MRRMLLPCAAVLVLGVHGSLAAQQAAPIASFQTDTSQFRSPTRARLTGIAPGMGHIYAGEPLSGVLYFSGVVGLLVASVAVTVQCPDDYGISDIECPSSTAEDALPVAMLGLWGWSIYDAGRAAQRTNAKQQRVRTSLILAPLRWSGAAGGGRGVKLGLSIATQ